MIEILFVICGGCLCGLLVWWNFRLTSLPPKAQLLCAIWTAVSSEPQNNRTKKSDKYIPEPTWGERA